MLFTGCWPGSGSLANFKPPQPRLSLSKADQHSAVRVNRGRLFFALGASGSERVVSNLARRASIPPGFRSDQREPGINAPSSNTDCKLEPLHGAPLASKELNGARRDAPQYRETRYLHRSRFIASIFLPNLRNTASGKTSVACSVWDDLKELTPCFRLRLRTARFVFADLFAGLGIGPS